MRVPPFKIKNGAGAGHKVPGNGQSRFKQIQIGTQSALFLKVLSPPPNGGTGKSKKFCKSCPKILLNKN
jgi:hypothetical protein